MMNVKYLRTSAGIGLAFLQNVRGARGVICQEKHRHVPTGRELALKIMQAGAPKNSKHCPHVMSCATHWEAPFFNASSRAISFLCLCFSTKRMFLRCQRVVPFWLKN